MAFDPASRQGGAKRAESIRLIKPEEPYG